MNITLGIVLLLLLGDNVALLLLLGDNVATCRTKLISIIYMSS